LKIPPELRLKDPRSVIMEITEFIKSRVENAHARGVVVGMSGGVDSSVVSTLCVKALGKDKVLGLIMPLWFTPRNDVEDAILLAKSLGIEYKYIPIDNIESSYKNTLKIDDDKKLKIPLANLRARIRMTILYFFANSLNYLVVGTGDKS